MDTSKWQDGFRKLRRATASSGLHMRGADPRGTFTDDGDEFGSTITATS
ncbi:hypothetical protein OH805_20240 [Streptomyces sp. NBC_00879]|nr:hypothetical protein OH805_20240 [Streptomyces sp. NBC_00879]